MSVKELILDIENKGIHLKLNNEQLKINAPKGILNEDLVAKIKQNKSEIIKELKLKEAAVNSINAPFITYNRNAKRNIYCFPPLVSFGFWCSSLSNYLKDFTLISFNFINKENIPCYYADLIINNSQQSDIIILAYSAGGKLAYEVVKELETRNINVLDVILIDNSKTLKQFTLKNAKEVVEQMGVYERLKEFNLDFYKEKVTSSIYDYMRYTLNSMFSGSIKANIHHIIANPDNNNNLSSFTQGQYKEYLGVGEHGTIFKSPFLEENAKLIKSIFLKG